MTNGDQVQGGGGGQRTYSEEDVMALMNEAAKRAATEAMKNTQKREEDEDDTAVSVINPKVVKQLKDTVAVFTALKDLSSNPLQKTIEETVGGMAASVVQSAFAPRGPPPKQDIVDKVLNSQFAFGLGSGLGQRAPELVETMGRTFGTDKTSQMVDSIMGRYGGGQGGRQLSPGPVSGPSSGPSSTPSSGPSSSSPPEQKTDKQTEKELLLSLDPNNPEHVSAYAETQGGLPVDVARKMLMIHQDAFIEQLKRDGMNVDQISTQRGSHTQSGQSVKQPSPIQQAPPVQPAQPVPPHQIRQDVPPTYPGTYSGSPIEQPSHQSTDDIEYAEYQDMTRPGQSPGPQPGHPPGYQPISQNNVDNQQIEMMKTFATDIGKVMGEMLNKIETLNNTVFTLQSEMNDIKKQGPRQPSPVHRDMPPGAHPRMTKYPGTPISPITHIDAPSLETFEEQVTDIPKVGLDVKRSGDFFEENVIDISNFQQELEEDAKLSVQQTKQQTPFPEPVQETIQSVPPAPATQYVPLPIQSTLPTAQAVKPLLQEKEKNIVDILKTEFGESKPKNTDTNNLKEISVIPDNKISEDKDDNKFVTPTNEQLKLSKKTGVRKKAEYRNIKPSFKKNDGNENKEENNIDREV